MPIIEITKRELRKAVYSSAVSLGAMIGLTHAVSKESAMKALMDKAPRGTEEPNRIAFNLGYNASLKML